MNDQTKIEEAGFSPASRIAAIGVSKILQIGARANAMKKDGLPVIILGAGEPDFDTPDNVKAAAKAAIDRGDTKYTALDGTPALKKIPPRKQCRLRARRGHRRDGRQADPLQRLHGDG